MIGEPTLTVYRGIKKCEPFYASIQF